MAFKRVEVRKKVPGPGWWSEKTRMEVVTAYVLLGKVSLVVATTGVPEDTVRKWKMAPWWKEAEDEIRRSSKLALSGRLNEVVAKTLNALEDRVANGDFIWDTKLQKFVRKPINAIVANKIAIDMIDRANLLEEKASKETVTEEGIQQRLDKIREEFRSMIKGKRQNEEGTIIDVTPTVHELPAPSYELHPSPPTGGYVNGNGTERADPTSDPSDDGSSPRDSVDLESDGEQPLYESGEGGNGSPAVLVPYTERPTEQPTDQVSTGS